MIFDITPFRSDKNIGKAYNERIACLPDDGWIIIRDADCMYLTPDYGNVIERIISRYGEEYAIIGALTNRLRNKEVLYNNEFSDNSDIRHHMNIAESVKQDTGIIDADICAGFFMMFKKETWDKVGGFSELPQDSMYADKRFSAKIKDAGGKIGIAKGLYLFHAYRLWAKSYDEACNSINHLR